MPIIKNNLSHLFFDEGEGRLKTIWGLPPLFFLYGQQCVHSVYITESLHIKSQTYLSVSVV